MVLMNFGTQVHDAVCGLSIEHVFENGNEHTQLEYALRDHDMKVGYHIKPSDNFLLNTELMNMDNEEKWAWLAVHYDYIPGSQPDYKEGKMVWSSIGAPRCGESNDKNPFGRTNLTTTEQ